MQHCHSGMPSLAQDPVLQSWHMLKHAGAPHKLSRVLTSRSLISISRCASSRLSPSARSARASAAPLSAARACSCKTRPYLPRCQTISTESLKEGESRMETSDAAGGHHLLGDAVGAHAL